MKALADAIHKTPIIDHHAHNLLRESELEARSFLSITTEAAGAALQATTSSLSHLRAVKQLAQILECEPTWDAVTSTIRDERKKPDQTWARRCFEGIETVLIDDGLDSCTVHTYSWHDRLTRSKCKRIVRIEAVAENIIQEYCKEFPDFGPNWDHELRLERSKDLIIGRFCIEIAKEIAKAEVVGFKSVICYRTGLAITAWDDLPRPHDGKKFDEEWNIMLQNFGSGKSTRLEYKTLNPYFLQLAANLIEDPNNQYRAKTPTKRKPLQFHTGLGDRDISLQQSSPSCMQPFIEEHPNLPIVLLHASYPFTREAGYFASVYENVYLDVGEVFPMVSREGQERVLAHALELCPSTKLLWSTDGHWFPETYLLAVIQVREALERVLSAYILDSTLEEQQAVRIVEDMFFRTANTLYHLDLPLSKLERSKTPIKNEPDGGLSSQNISLYSLAQFLKENPTIKYIRLQWLDYTSTLRGRILTIKQALKLLESQSFVGITKACLGLLQEDMAAPGFTGVGAYDLVPQISSLRRGDDHKLASYATVQCEFRDGDSGAEVSICPRTALRKVVEKASRAKAVECQVGFELEFVLMRYKAIDGHTVYGGSPVSQGHAWSTTRAMHSSEMMNVLETILIALETAGISVQQFHPETAPGQYEIITDPLPPLEAVDTLLATRDIISSVAADFSLRATFIPKPISGAAGTGAHMHISLRNYNQAYYKTFYAGVLKHLQAIAAFTYCNEMSYERAVGGVWAGGRYVTWGTQNREAPLRKIKDSHWEIKALDGFANMYLVLAAVIAAGLQGLHDKTELKWKDCQADPETLDETQRKELGIDSMLPSSFREALDFLRKDTELKELMGEGVVDTYLTVKTAEADVLAKMGSDKRRNWLIERY